MSMSTDQDALKTVVRNGQIIVVALVAGLVIFLAIAATLDIGPGARAGANAGIGGEGAGRPAQVPPILSYTSVAFAAVALPLSLLLPNLMAKPSRKAMAAGNPTSGARPVSSAEGGSAPVGTPVGGLPAAFLSQLIVGAAINQGAAFFAGVAYMVEKNPIAIAVAGVLVVAVAARFPTANRAERWIERQREKLVEDPRRGPSSY